MVLPHIEEAQIAQSIISSCESASVFEEQIRRHPTHFGANARTRTELGSLMLATDYLKAQRVRTVFYRGYLNLMEQADVLVLPVAPEPPPRLDEQPEPWDWRDGARMPPNRFRWPFNLTGAPSVSVPCGFTSGGLPIGMQIAGRPLGDETVLKVAHAYEQLTDWHSRRPPISSGSAAGYA
jgi:aspartyl-tRNA(Asn)/glutamyl-tRNA(Gln) amidotransferase subunit A